ncbi:hypothetical protein NBRC116494_28600 [Aurantivibrio plasticivorans]
MAVAFFDVDGTLLRLKSMVSFYYFYVEKVCLTRSERLEKIHAFREYVSTNKELPRAALNAWYYQLFEGESIQLLECVAAQWCKTLTEYDWLEEPLEYLKQHKAAGNQVVMVSGSADFILSPLVRMLEVDGLLAAPVEVVDGLLTGRLIGQPMIGLQKMVAVRDWLSERDIDPAICYGYGDHITDVEMLDYLGNSSLVNPSSELENLGREKGWAICKDSLSTIMFQKASQLC